jgi:hypothetical protein
MPFSPGTERRIATFAPPLLVGLLALPFVLRQNAWWEWTTAFWLLERQTDFVAAHGVPTLFLHTGSGAFDAFYVFYAGFTFSVLAYPAAVLGAWPVFAASCAGAMMAGYLGIWWTARNLGLSHRLAILPGLAFATTPYLLTELYGRGSWAELVGANAAAVLLGGLTALLWRPDRHRGRVLTALTAGGAVLAGTHNLSLLLATLVLPLVVGALLPLAPRAAGVRGGARALGTGLLAIAVGVGLTGAWLVPNLWLGPGTYVASAKLSAATLQGGGGLVALSNVLSPWPRVPAGFSGSIYAQISALALAWALAALLTLAWTRRRAPGRAVAAGAALIATGSALLALVVHPSWWLSFPRLLQAVQSPVRLLPYLAMVVALAIVVALTALPAGRPRRVLTATLVGAVGVQGAIGVFIAVDTKAAATLPTAPLLRHGDVRADTEPPAFSAPRIAAQFQFRVLEHPRGPQPRKAVGLRLGDVATSTDATMDGTGRAGERLATAVVWSPLVRLDGDVRTSGRTKLGNMVVTVTRTDFAGRWRATVRPACGLLCLEALSGDAPWHMLAGRLLTLLSALIVAAATGLGLLRRRRVRRAAAPRRAAPVERPAADAPHPVAAPAPR